jgi:hypothetical protein
MSKGICFTEGMFKAVINGSKTQTRRMLSENDNDLVESFMGGYTKMGFGNTVPKGVVKPRYKVGEKVYLKEPYRITKLANESVIRIELMYSKIDSELWAYKVAEKTTKHPLKQHLE